MENMRGYIIFRRRHIIREYNMNKISDFLAGIKVLEEVDSVENGKITVVKSLAFGTYFQVGGLTQSGGIIKNIWRHSLRKVHKTKDKVQRVLVLGLGGGSIIEVINKYWPEATITAIDIDPVIVKLGMKYLGLNDKSIKIHIEDAEKFLTTHNSQPTTYYDLILVDLYRGDEYPKKFETKDYIQLVGTVLASRGIAVFNRLYYGEKRPQSVKFGNLLEKVFYKVDVVYPEANIMFICRN
jgi:spermidine synthase